MFVDPLENMEPASPSCQVPVEELLAALRRLDELLQKAVEGLQAGTSPETGLDLLRGLHLSREEMVRSLVREPGASPLCRKESIEGPLVQFNGDHSRLATLLKIFSLSPVDLDLLLIALGPEIDLRYERLYAYLQDDVTKKKPGVELALNLLCPSLQAKLLIRERLSPNAPLRKNQLVQLFDDPAYPHSPLLGKFIKVDDRVVDYLFGSDALDSSLAPYAQVLRPRTRMQDLFLPDELKRRVGTLVEEEKAMGQPLVIYFQGLDGVGKSSFVEALCRQHGGRLLLVDGGRLAKLENAEFSRITYLVSREAKLQDAILYWCGFETLLEEEQQPRLERLWSQLEERSGLTFLAGQSVWEPKGLRQKVAFMRFEIPVPSSTERLHLWARALEGRAALDEGVNLNQLAGKFRFSGGQIRDAAVTACSLVRRRHSAENPVSQKDLLEACRLQSNRKLARLARRITSRYCWEDIVLPVAQLTQLEEICGYVKYRSQVYDQWGFDRKLSGGKGLNILFAGSSGTGKTMAAEVMANELGLDLYKIDLATVVSKYIGETEKNLARIFAEAESSNAILFFDEADALFGKRSEVRDSHDRYSNIEISYLLQKMEEYEGVSILATNLRKNMDDAFVRRLAFAVNFPFPDLEYRQQIWEKVWPLEMPLAEDLDLVFIARQFKIAGGNIRNIALAAAFLAARDGHMVTMEHLMRATKREFQKMGKVCVEADFGPYYPLIANS